MCPQSEYYNKNIENTGDYLLTELKGNVKFDVIVGNPPYQETDKSGNKKPSGHNLWVKFFDKSLEILAEDGFLCFITPPFFSPAYKEIIGKCFGENTTHFLNIGECGNHFTVGTLFSYYILQKRKPSAEDKVEYVSQFGDSVYKGEMKFSKEAPFMPMLVCDSSFSILDKTIYSDEPKMSFIEDFTAVTFDEKGKHLIRDGNNFRKTNDTHPVSSVKKLVVSKSGYLKPEFDNGSYGLTRNCFYLTVKSKKEALFIIRLLESKLYKFILSICKWNGFTSKRVLERLPYPQNIQITFTNEDLYKLFSLTEEEIDLIEATVK